MSGEVGLKGAIRRVLRAGEPADWQKVLTFVLVWAGAVIVALSFVKVSNVHNPPIWTRPEYTLKYGYTYSLLLMAIPLLALIWWYRISRKNDRDGSLQRLVRAVIRNAGLTALLLVVFDVLFATLLFDFPDPNAIIGWHFPGYKWANDCSTIWQFYRPSCYAFTIPIEEVLFYVSGAAVLRGMYIWASEDFLVRYTMIPADYDRDARSVRRLLTWNWSLVGLTLAILAIGIYAKRQYGDGLPIYLMLQLLILSSPVALLYTRVRAFINTRALLLVTVLQILVSVIWEATAALPYGWWSYKPGGMIGEVIEPWSNLPVEASFFWVAVGWSAMFLHEATKIKVRSNRSWASILTGRGIGQAAHEWSAETDDRQREAALARR